MKKAVLLLSTWVLLSFLAGCSKTNAKPPWVPQASMQTQTTPQVQSQTPKQTPQTTASMQDVQNLKLTLQFSFGQKTGLYTGRLIDGVPNGDGSFTTSNDEGTEWTYTGQWVDGHFQGDGKTEWKDGWSEKGVYENDYLADGESYWNGKLAYKGAYSSDEFHGQGTTYDTLGNVIFKGQFENGYLKESEEDRITRADMIAPESKLLSRKDYANYLNKTASYMGMWVELQGKVNTIWGDSASVELIIDIDGNSSYPVNIVYRYAVGEQQMKQADKVTVFGAFSGTYIEHNSGKDYTIPTIDAHVIYIE